jgi:hypothetical protein
MLLVVQFGLAYYARQVLAGAAHDAAAAAARERSGPGQGVALAEQLIGEAAGSLFDSHAVSTASDGDTITVTATGEVVSLLPFFGTITVTATGSANVERFEPQGGSP